MTFEEWWQEKFIDKGIADWFDKSPFKEAWEQGAREEREVCAKLCDDGYMGSFGKPKEFAYDVRLQDAIRARGEGER